MTGLTVNNVHWTVKLQSKQRPTIVGASIQYALLLSKPASEAQSDVRSTGDQVWLGKHTALDMTPLGWLGRKTSTQANKVR